MNDFKKDSSDKILFLLNLLYDKELSKNEIIEEFKKNNIEIKKTSINNYINKLKQNDICVITKKIKNINYYHLQKEQFINIEKEELEASSDVKKLIISQKKLDIIKKSMQVFYKFALHNKNKQTKAELINFYYFSKINWALLKQLEKHCKNKDIITIDYLYQDGKNKFITIHADSIKFGDYSNRLYLSGILEGDNKISQLPIDKIFMVKKNVKRKVRINLEIEILKYQTSKKMYKKAEFDKKETIDNINCNLITLKRPLDDTFFTVQRLLHFCPDLYYISDEKIKNLVKEKLYTLKDMYENDA